MSVAATVPRRGNQPSLTRGPVKRWIGPRRLSSSPSPPTVDADHNRAEHAPLLRPERASKQGGIGSSAVGSRLWHPYRHRAHAISSELCLVQIFVSARRQRQPATERASSCWTRRIQAGRRGASEKREQALEMESPRSPEAEIGHRVEDLWEVAEPQLSPSEKLNSCFEDIPVASFPSTHPSQVIGIPCNASLAEAVEILSKNKILSAPIRNVEAPEEASWMDKYIGIVEFAGIAMWLLSQSDVAANGKAGPPVGSPVANLAPQLGSFTFRRTSSGRVETTTNLESDEAASVGGSFFETLTSSEFYKNTKVGDISGSFRWAPFLALQPSDTFLTMLLLLSKYRMKSLPVVEVGGDKIENIITQSSVVHMLAECVGLSWFESWGTKKLSELGLPIMKPSKLVKVNEDQPVLKAFQLMREKGVGGLPVMDTSGAKAIGNISIRDVQYLLTAPKIYKQHRTITAKDFLTAVRHHLQEQQEASPLLHGVVTCEKDDTIKDIILKLDSAKISRIYVVDDKGNTEGVITLRDIISKLVHEPRHYFGDFFDGVVPLPANSTV